jgi:hypothetical protein
MSGVACANFDKVRRKAKRAEPLEAPRQAMLEDPLATEEIDDDVS